MPTYEPYEPYAPSWESIELPPSQARQDEDSLMKRLASGGLTSLQYVGETLGKSQQALFGLLAGKPRELWNLLPFSDTLGITSSEGWFGNEGAASDYLNLQATDDEDAVSGRKLLETWGAVGADEEGWDRGDIAGLALDIFADPTIPLSLGAKAVRPIAAALQKAGLLTDAATAARQMGKVVPGQATARHVLTSGDVLSTAKPDDIFGALSAHFKPGETLPQPSYIPLQNIPKARTEAMQDALISQFHRPPLPSQNPVSNVPATLDTLRDFLHQYVNKDISPQQIKKFADELDKPIGGLLKYGPVVVPGEGISRALDAATGYLKYGTKFARGVNTASDVQHSTGKGRESRYAQEILMPSVHRYRNEIDEDLMPDVAEIISKTARGSDELLKMPSPPGATVDLRQRAYQSAEGVGPDPVGINPVNQRLGEKQLRHAQDADLKVDTLHDDYIKNFAARQRLGGYEQPDLLRLRDDLLRNLPLGTSDGIDVARTLGALKSDLGFTDHTAALRDKDVSLLKRLFKKEMPNLPPTYSTVGARQAKETLDQYGGAVFAPAEYTALKALLSPDEFKLLKQNSLSQKQFDKLQGTLTAGGALDRYEGLAEFALKHPQDVMEAGLFMDLGGAWQLKTAATADKVARAKAFRNAIIDPAMYKQYAGGEMITQAEGAKLLGMNVDAFKSESLPLIPKELVNELLPKAYEPPKGGLPGWLADQAKQITAINKAWMTGAITNPSFPMRNRVSGALANAYFGLTSPMSALKGLSHFLSLGMLNSTDAATIARGGVVKGLAKDPAIKTLATRYGRQLTDDLEATDFVRELEMASGGSRAGRHTVDSLPENLLGEGEFVGGMAGEGGKDSFSWGKMLGEMGTAAKQTLSPLELAIGAPGVSWANKGVKRLKPTSGLLQAGATINDYVEAQNRMGPFLDMLRGGFDPGEAMRRVNRAQINYARHNYTDTENQLLTTLFPFYKFLKGSGLAHARQLAERPGGALSQILQAGAQLHDPEGIVPEYIKENITVPINKTPLAGLLGSTAPDSDRYLTGLGLAFESPLQFVGGESRGALPILNSNLFWELAGATNPALIKAPIEALTNTSLFMQDEMGGGRKLDSIDPVVGRIWRNIQEIAGEPKDESRPDLMYPLVESMLSNSPLSRILSTTRTLTDQRKELPVKLLNVMSGLKLQDIEQKQRENVIRGMVNKHVDDMRGAQQQTDFYVPRRVQDTYSPAEKRDYKEALALKRMLSKAQRKRARQQRMRLLPTIPLGYEDSLYD